MNKCVIPICGSASRIGNIPKFMLPIPEKKSLIKKHIIDVLESKFKPVIIITPDYANMIYNYLKKFFDMKEIQIIVNETKTMSETILSIDYHNSVNYSLIMPDTYLTDNSVLKKMLKVKNETKCDVVLGIFEIREEQRGKLGQVLFDDNDYLLDVIDKDKSCTYKWAWGTMLWNSKFSNHIDPTTSHIGYALKPALKDGLIIKVVCLKGEYYDCGTINEYTKLLTNIN